MPIEIPLAEDILLGVLEFLEKIWEHNFFHFLMLHMKELITATEIKGIIDSSYTDKIFVMPSLLSI